jgi:anthranilate phosphoribosyltransferase
VENLVVGSVAEAATEMRNVLRGQTGPRADMALVNAGAALYVAGKVPSIVDGYELAAETVASGKAVEKLKALVEMTNAA